MPSREARTSQIDEGASTSASSRTRAKRSDASEQVSSQTPAPSRRKSSVPSRSEAAQDESATELLQPQAHGEPAFPLTRVQKIVKMESGYIFPINISRLTAAFRIDEQAQISREAAFILALAAVCYYYLVIYLLIDSIQEELTKRIAQAGATEMNASGRKELALSDLGESDQESDPEYFRKPFGLLSASTQNERVPKNIG